MSQCARILSHLEFFGSIDPMAAMLDLGVYRLAARISDLKADGHSIRSEMVTVQNRFGEDCRVARYSIDLEQYLADAIVERGSFNTDVTRYNELTAKIANLRTRIERMKAKP